MEITFLVILPFLWPKKVFGLVKPAPSDPTRRSHIQHEQVFSSKTSASLGKVFAFSNESEIKFHSLRSSVKASAAISCNLRAMAGGGIRIILDAKNKTG